MRVFIPIETKSRELDSRLLVARELVSRGIEVIIGHNKRINLLIKESTPSIYFAKSCATIDLPLFIDLKRLKHKIVVLDEEAIIHLNKDKHIKSRFDKRTLELLSYYFSWGKYDFDLVKDEFNQFENKIIVTGNPRVDLLRKDLRNYNLKPVQELKKKYGDYILFPSSFAMCNHYTEPGPRIAWRKKVGMIETQKDIDYFTKYVEHFNEIFNCFLRDILRLADLFPSQIFIVRPHPSENKEVLQKRFLDKKNVIVTSQGPIIPWLYGSKCILHNGCTTAVESYLLDKPVISYRPIQNDNYDLMLPNKISHQVFDFNQLKDTLNKIINNKNDYYAIDYNEKSSALLSYYISFYDGDFSFKIISDNIYKLSLDFKYKYLDLIFSRFLNFYFYCKRSLINLLLIYKKENPYIKQKFGFLSKSEIEELLSRSNFILNEKLEIKVDSYAKNVYKLTLL